MADNIYEKLSAERKSQQQNGKYPEWFTTGAYQMFKESYEYQADGFNEQIKRIAEHLSKYAVKFLPETHPYFERITKNYGSSWELAFYKFILDNHLCPATPVLANTGTDRGCSVACSGQYVEDSVEGFYEAYKEAALLSKEGFGTSAYLGDIRGRGESIKSGGKADGTTMVKKALQQVAKDISQGGVRRGAVASYLPIAHKDFDEWNNDLFRNPAGQNIGWIVYDKDIEKLRSGDELLNRKFARAIKTRLVAGKGYIWKVDTVNRLQPDCYKKHGLTNKASNLCTEITLHADKDHTYTCVISSLNCLHYDTWKDTGAVFVAMVFLDALCTEFIEKARNIKGLEKAVRYTEKARSVGLGLLGWHSYLQSKMIPFESLEAAMLNIEIFSHMDKESLAASQWLAEVDGEPLWCKGFGTRFTHRMAVAPNVSSAILAGQVSQGIEPWFSNAFTQTTAAGEMQRINPEFLKLAKERGKYNKALITDMLNRKGSVQHLDWLSQHEKDVFKTAFEIDQMAIIRLASDRQRYIDQGQSLNLFFSSEADESYIAEVHKAAILDPWIKGLYYLRTESGVSASKGECKSCES